MCLYSYLYLYKYSWKECFVVGRDSSVGIATRYGLDGPGIESRWGRDFPHPSRPALVPTQPQYNEYRFFPADKAAGAWCWPPTPIKRRGWRKSRTIPLLPLWAFVSCSRVNFTFYLLTLPAFNTLNAELNPICHLLALLGAHHIFHLSRIRVNRKSLGKLFYVNTVQYTCCSSKNN